ncbi:MAG: PD-(D/E)XK nuclease family protein [Gammaproteobacteria bacterium]|nr:PD-(D/E)XK nuclease family protein [Gammaproteobacteria bacterium]
MKEFFKELNQHLEVARQENRARYGQFFDRLKPGLDSARKLERELGKRLAHRFNVLDYMRTDELGLSRIIADLLSPEATHGQGSLFLYRLLDHFHDDLARSELDLADAQVFVEYEIANQRRIDIVVRMPHVNGKVFCLAIENKPYAGDQEGQVRDYLDYLEQEHASRFLLIYLSPAGEGPSEWSLPQREIKHWRGRLFIMPYHDQYGGDTVVADTYRELRARVSLSNWLAECRKTCEVEKLRSFLKDTELFCRKTFGGYDMTTDSEARAVKEYLLSEPQNLTTAKAVFDCWPEVVAHVSEQFLEMLRSKIEVSLNDRLGDLAQGLDFRYKYKGEGNRSWLSIHRGYWKPYQDSDAQWDAGRRASIVLESDGTGLSNWWFTIRLPLPESGLANDGDRQRFTGIQNINSGWAAFGTRGYTYVDSRFRNWDPLMPELGQECSGDGGKVCEYYVRTIVEFAVYAIPQIDEIEGKSEP